MQSFIPSNIQSLEKIEPKIADTAFIHDSAIIIGAVEIAEDVSIWPNTTLRGDEGKIVIGEKTNIQDGSTIHMTGNLSDTIIGAKVTVGHNCILHGCKIGEGALIGMGSIILDNAEIGEWTLIGAGSLVTQNKVIPPRSLVFGNPAKVIRELTKEELKGLEESWKHYVDQAHRYIELYK